MEARRLDELFEAACALRDQERYADAQEILERLVERSCNHAAVYAVLGDVCWERGLIDKAIESFRTAIRLAPKSETASLALFHCLWEKGDRSGAREEMRRFLSVADSEEYRRVLAAVHDSLESRQE